MTRETIPGDKTAAEGRRREIERDIKIAKDMLCRFAAPDIIATYQKRLDKLRAELASLPAPAPAQSTTGDVREALKDVLASLVAATSLLKRGGKKAAPSDKMFNQMVRDYEASIERGRRHALASSSIAPGWREGVEAAARWHDQKAEEARKWHESLDRDSGDLNEHAGWRAWKDADDRHRTFAAEIRALQPPTAVQDSGAGLQGWVKELEAALIACRTHLEQEREFGRLLQSSGLLQMINAKVPK